MPSPSEIVVVLGTGGTIAGRGAQAGDLTSYKSGALSADELLAAVPALAGQAIECESLAQIDSSDMDHAIWQRLALALRRHLARPEVAAVVVTHGTDTLEETAFFLHHTVVAAKPVILTAAMRPATAPSPDGPQNLVDAMTVAREPGARGVLVLMNSELLAGAEMRKLHGYRVDAFSSGGAGPLALVQDGRLRQLRAWPGAVPAHGAALDIDCADWPLVDIVSSHAGARGAVLDAVIAAGAQGVVIAGTGNGSVHASLLQAAKQAQAAGVPVWRATRCTAGGVVGGGKDALPAAGDATPAQARVLLMLELIKGRATAD